MADVLPQSVAQPVAQPAAPQEQSLSPSGRMPGDTQGYGIDDVQPEEQAQYTQYLKQIGKYVYGPGKIEIIRHMNDKKQTVPDAVANTAVLLADQHASMAEANGVQLSPDVTFHAMTEVVAMLMDLGDMADIWPFPAESDEYMRAQEQSFTKAQKIIGEELMQNPEFRREAQDNAATRVAMEADAGSLDPNFEAAVNNLASQNMMDIGAPQIDPVAQGVNNAMQPQPSIRGSGGPTR